MRVHHLNNVSSAFRLLDKHNVSINAFTKYEKSGFMQLFILNLSG
jgi:hypothetical protein